MQRYKIVGSYVLVLGIIAINFIVKSIFNPYSETVFVLIDVADIASVFAIFLYMKFVWLPRKLAEINKVN